MALLVRQALQEHLAQEVTSVVLALLVHLDHQDSLVHKDGQAVQEDLVSQDHQVNKEQPDSPDLPVSQADQEQQET